MKSRVALLGAVFGVAWGALILSGGDGDCFPDPVEPVCQVDMDCRADQRCDAEGQCVAIAVPERPARFWGVDANYVVAYQEAGGEWQVDGAVVDPVVTLATHGANTFRLRVWVQQGAGSFEPGTLDNDALVVAERAQRAGMYVIPTLFMTRGWGADTAQPAPLDWETLSLAERADAARTWAADAARQLREAGIRTRTWGIGNETDYGFCGVYRRTSDLAVLRDEVWPQMAILMRATIDGVRDAIGRSDIEFVLHISRGYDTDLAVAFFETMRAEGVDFSLAGLSYYPSAWGQAQTDRFETTVTAIHDTLGVPILVPEYAWPADDSYAGWNKPIAGYTFDEAGQAAFVRDMKARVLGDARFAGAIYWTPEEDLTAAQWSVMSLFVPAPDRKSPRARAALDAL